MVVRNDVNRRGDGVGGGGNNDIEWRGWTVSLFPAQFPTQKRARETDLLIQSVAELGDARLDLIELATLLPSISFDDIHGTVVWWNR